MANSLQSVDIVMPVHNEGASIEGTLREFHTVVSKNSKIPIRFVICEDGSSDNTVAVLTHVSKELPIHLITSNERKGYSRAVIDGFTAASSEIVGFIDSDGQCDPEDFNTLFKLISNPKVDFVIGYRNPRSDHWVRLLMSGLFGTVYRGMFSIPFKDPSCPYLLIKKGALDKILEGNLGILKQGFWWEFLARAISLNLSIVETPVKHRPRTAGETQIYKPTKVPRIAFEHILGLFKLKKELKYARKGLK